MATVGQTYPGTLWTSVLVPAGAYLASSIYLDCPKTITTALLGTAIYAVTVGSRVAHIPSRSLGCGRVIRIIQGSVVAFGLFYKLSEHIPEDDQLPLPAIFYAKSFASLAASYIFPFVENFYECGRNI